MDEPPRIEISGSLEQGDFVSALRWFAFRRRRLYLIVCWLFIIGGAVLWALTLSQRPRGGAGSEDWISLAVAVVLVVVVVVVATWYSLHRAAKRQYTSTPGVALPTTYVFDRDGVSTENAESTSRLSWESYYEVHEIAASFILLRSRVLMHILPKRYFRDDQQLAEFRALVQDRLGEKAKLKYET